VNRAHVPGASLFLQGAWASVLVLARTHNPTTGAYGNLYSNLLDYVVSSALIFYLATIAGLFRLRHARPDDERPYRAPGYPIVPALYLTGAGATLVLLLIFRPATTLPGLAIILIGVPVYFLLGRAKQPALVSGRNYDKPG
jgi:APA family basic amino acid/polyamine antiporter